MKIVDRYRHVWLRKRWAAVVHTEGNSIWIEIPFGKLDDRIIDIVMGDLMEDRDVEGMPE